MQRRHEHSLLTLALGILCSCTWMPVQQSGLLIMDTLLRKELYPCR